MAEGHQADLEVTISVSTEEVRAGFERVASLSEQYAARIGKIWDGAFKGTIDPQAFRSSISGVAREMREALEPIRKLADGKYTAGKIVVGGGAEEIQRAQQAITNAIIAAQEAQRAQTKEARDAARAAAAARRAEREKERAAAKERIATQKRLNELKKQQKKHEEEILKAYRNATVVLRYMLRALRSAINASREWIKTASEIYDQQFKLAAALRVHNDLTDGQVRAIFKQVDAMSELTGLSREVQYSAAQILASYVGAADGLNDMLGAIDALTLKMYGYNATAQNAATVARIVGRALSGNLQTLKRYGIELTKAEEEIVKSSTATRAEKVAVLTKAIARYTGDLSKFTETWSGQTNIAKVRIEKTKEQLGLALQNFLLPIVKCVNVILKGVSEIATWVRYISVIAFGNNIKGAEELAGAFEEAEEAAAELQGRLLGFDKFNVLSGSSAEVSDFDPTGLLPGEEAEEIPAWIAQLSEISGLAETLRVAIFGIGAALAVIVGHMAVLSLKGLVATLKGIASSIGLVNTGLGLTKIQTAALVGGIALLAAGVYSVISAAQDLGRWEEMTGGERAAAVLKLILGLFMSVAGVVLLVRSGVLKSAAAMFVHAKASLAAALSNEALAASLKGVALWTASVSVAAAGIAIFVANLSQMGSTKGTIVGVTAALVALAAAIIAVKVAGAGWAAALQAAVIAGGIAFAVGSMIATTSSAKGATVTTYANGGIPERGQLFIANENGPELVANIGGNTSVANNGMIVSAIEEAAYRGFSRANGEGGSQGVSITLDGSGVRNDALVRALMPALRTEIKRQGGLKKAFGGD